MTKPTPTKTAKKPKTRAESLAVANAAKAKIVRVTYEKAFPEYVKYIAELVSHATACDLVGIDNAEEFKGWIARFPDRRREAKRARADGILQAHRDAAAGKQGWQSRFRLLESTDEHYLRAAPGRPTNATDPYSRAMRRKK